MEKIHVKLFEIWTSGSGGDAVQRKGLRMTDRGKIDDGRRPITIKISFGVLKKKVPASVFA